MGSDNKQKSTKNSKKTDGKFRSKHVNHSPQEESARAKFGLSGSASDNDRKANGQ